MIYFGTFMILVAFFAGYLLNIRQPVVTRNVNSVLDLLTLAILMLLGFELGGLDNLQQNLLLAGSNVAYFLLIVGAINLVSLLVLMPKTNTDSAAERPGIGQLLQLFTGSLKYPLTVVAGVLLALLTGWQAESLADISNLLLIVLLFLVGISVRASDIRIKEILVNRSGIQIALIVILGSIFGGSICAWLTETELFASLAVASGFGWYTLSGVLIGNSLGPVLGSTAFLFDLTRELIALTVIPMLMRINSGSAIGISGATAMDFTLPLIERSGGAAMVPVALSSGFILSFLSPVLILFFLSFSPA